MKKIIALALCLVAIITMFSACSEAEKVNHNISLQAQQFECLRKITVYNARTDTIVLEAEGYMDISNNDTNELVVTCKVGANEYKKNYVYLNEWTIYVVEDITGTHTDPYHYKMYFHTEILPDVEIKP
jgi:ABC-type Fe3+-hydroxamate transport system substrate-binding protein